MKPPRRVPQSKIASGVQQAAFLGVKSLRSIMKLNLFCKLGIGILRKSIMRLPPGSKHFAKAAYAECGIKIIGLWCYKRLLRLELAGRCS
jgi:hypothetical protein